MGAVSVVVPSFHSILPQSLHAHPPSRLRLSSFQLQNLFVSQHIPFYTSLMLQRTVVCFSRQCSCSTSDESMTWTDDKACTSSNELFCALLLPSGALNIDFCYIRFYSLLNKTGYEGSTLFTSDAHNPFSRRVARFL